MVILIDAYNVLKQELGSVYITEAQQEQFLDELWAYSQRKHHKLIVVFDGGPEVHPYRIVRGLLEIVYAGRNRSADDVIKELLECSRRDNTLLITLDRALRNYAARYDIISLEPELFRYYSRSHAIVQPPRILKDKYAPTKRSGHESTPELDALMNKAAQITFVKDEDASIAENIGKPIQKLSKYEKKNGSNQ